MRSLLTLSKPWVWAYLLACLLAILAGCAMLGRDFQRVHIEKKCEVTMTRGGATYGQPDANNDWKIIVGPGCTADVEASKDQEGPSPGTGTEDG